MTATDLDRRVSPAAEMEIVQDCAAPMVLFAERQGHDFVATFSEPIEESSVTGAVTLATAAGPMAGSVTASGATATFTPSSPPAAEALRFEVSQQVTDLAGNALAYPFSQVFDAGAAESFLSGTVIDDATGRPLAGARVVVTATDGVALVEPLAEQTTSADGRFLVPVPSGTHDVTIGRPGLHAGLTHRDHVDGCGCGGLRATPDARSSGLLSFGDALLDVPAGALTASANVTLTAVGEVLRSRFEAVYHSRSSVVD